MCHIYLLDFIYNISRRMFPTLKIKIAGLEEAGGGAGGLGGVPGVPGGAKAARSCPGLSQRPLHLSILQRPIEAGGGLVGGEVPLLHDQPGQRHLHPRLQAG